jgi:hypothetical protein
MMARLSKPLWLVNALLLAAAIYLGVSLAKDLTRSRPLPESPAPRRAAAPAPPEEKPAAAVEDKLQAYNVIVARHLFNPSRSEGGVASAAPAAPLPPKPLLLGVVVDGPKSRAYLEEASTKRVFGYKIGDQVSGGRLEQITDEKVVIVRPDGTMDVMLHDPAKPKPAPAPAQPGAPGAQPGAQAGAPPVPGQPVPGQPPVPPRALRRLQPEQSTRPPQQ